MKKAGAALAILLAACSADHGVIDSDAAATDAGTEPRADARVDAAVIRVDGGTDAGFDAFVCPDADGDGARDARCGGNDCDDADPTIGPSASVCTGPTRMRHCLGARVAEDDCMAPTPDCDARMGVCAATACGDGVVQPDEQCDATGGLCGDCLQYCWDNQGCAAVVGAPNCVQGPPMYDTGICAPSTPGGAPPGSNCTASNQCESSYCDPRGGRCSAYCDYPCPAADGRAWCSRSQLYAATNFGEVPLPGRCQYSCDTDADCHDGRRCTLVRMYATVPLTVLDWMISATCVAPRGGADPLGTPCSPDLTTCDSNNCAEGACTTTCLIDADCPPPFAHCAPFTRYVSTHQAWPAPRVCVP